MVNIKLEKLHVMLSYIMIWSSHVGEWLFNRKRVNGIRESYSYGLGEKMLYKPGVEITDVGESKFWYVVDCINFSGGSYREGDGLVENYYHEINWYHKAQALVFS